MSKLKYSTSLEELSYHKDAASLKDAADSLIGEDEDNIAGFFRVGSELNVNSIYFMWHGDGYRTYLIFKTRTAEKKIRRCKDRVEAFDVGLNQNAESTQRSNPSNTPLSSRRH